MRRQKEKTKLKILSRWRKRKRRRQRRKDKQEVVGAERVGSSEEGTAEKEENAE